MDFELTKEQKLLKSAAREVMEKEVIPFADEWDKNHLLHDRKTLKMLLDKLLPLGWIGATLPEEAGGQSLDHVSYGIIVEEIGRASVPLASILALIDVGIECILVFGTPAQKEKFLPSLWTCEKLSCSANSEASSGSNPDEIETSAVLDGNYYVINGTKIWITNGSISDLAIITAQTERGSGRSGICRLIVEKEVSPYETRDLPLMGFRAAPPSELVFTDCRVPKENMLIPPGGKGLEGLLTAFVTGRINVASCSVGVAQAAIDASIRFAKERYQFGKPIGKFQLIQEMVVDMVAQTQAARLLTFQARSMIDKGIPCLKEASIAKLYATQAAVKVTSMAVQIHGTTGVSEELPLQRYFRDACCNIFPDGTIEIQKLIAGRSILGLSAIR
jgi:alkylation response protein AidB-like acyl-CoA dehydrogenase